MRLKLGVIKGVIRGLILTHFTGPYKHIVHTKIIQNREEKIFEKLGKKIQEMDRKKEGKLIEENVNTVTFLSAHLMSFDEVFFCDLFDTIGVT